MIIITDIFYFMHFFQKAIDNRCALCYNCISSNNTVITKGGANIMIQIDPRSRTPIYEQLVNGIIKLVVSGEMGADDAVPSVRVLAEELFVNPNTVQKAFSELERRGVLYSVPGKGRFVNGDIALMRTRQFEAQLELLANAIRKAVFMGVSRESILALAEEITGGKSDDRD